MNRNSRKLMHGRESPENREPGKPRETNEPRELLNPRELPELREPRKSNEPREPILLLIDGHCLLCHGLTRFVAKRDRARRFRFAALQSEAGKARLRQAGWTGEPPDSFVMVYGNRIFTKSSAALRVFRHLGGGWTLLYGWMLIPASVRDWVYEQIAKRRYRWFGKSGVCLMPDEELRNRFIEEP